MEKTNYITKEEKKNFLFRLHDTFCNMSIFTMILTLIIAIIPLVYVLFSFFYILITFLVTFIVVVITLGLIFLEKDNFISKMWAQIENLDVNRAINLQQTAGPVLLVILGVLLVLVYLGFFLKWRDSKAKSLAVMIVGSMIFFLSLLFILTTKGGNA